MQPENTGSLLHGVQRKKSTLECLALVYSLNARFFFQLQFARITTCIKL